MNPQFVIIETPAGLKALVNVADIKYAHPYAQDVINNVNDSGVQIEFRSGGGLNVPGLTVEGLASVVNGAPY